MPKDIIGSIDPASMREIDDGLYVRGKLDIARSDNARDVWELVKNSVVSLSFGYLATDKATRDDGVQELRELDLFEISLVAAPANADTRILSYKSADTDTDTAEPHPAFIRQEAQLREHKLLSGFLVPPYGSRPVERDPVEREEKRQMRELRLEYDRFRLEESLGFDEDLIRRAEGEWPATPTSPRLRGLRPWSRSPAARPPCHHAATRAGRRSSPPGRCCHVPGHSSRPRR